MDTSELLCLAQIYIPGNDAPALMRGMSAAYHWRGTPALAALAGIPAPGSPFAELAKLRTGAARAIEETTRGERAAPRIATVREYAVRWQRMWAALSHQRTAVARRARFDYIWRSAGAAPVVYQTECVRFETLMVCATLARMLYNAALAVDAQCGSATVAELRAAIGAYEQPLAVVREMCLPELAAYEPALEHGAGGAAVPVQRIGLLCDVHGAPPYPVESISRRALEALEALCRAKMQFLAMRIAVIEQQRLAASSDDAAAPMLSQREIANLFWYAYNCYKRAHASTQCEAHLIYMARCLASILAHKARALLGRARRKPNDDDDGEDSDDDDDSDDDSDGEAATATATQPETPENLVVGAIVLLTEADAHVQRMLRYAHDAQLAELSESARKRQTEIATQLADAYQQYRVLRGGGVLLSEQTMPAASIAASIDDSLRITVLARYAAPRAGYFYREGV